MTHNLNLMKYLHHFIITARAGAMGRPLWYEYP